VRDNRHLDVIARLAPGATPEQAQADLSAIAARLAAENPDTNREWGAATVVPLREVTTGDVDRALLVVLAVVSMVLLIGCANLANLMLARASARQRELAIRTALGAGRWRIVRQLSTEALVLSIAGGALGLLLAVWSVEVMLRLSADTLPRVEEVTIGAGVIAFGLAVSVLTSLLFGLLPAIQVVRAAPQEGLRGGRGTVGSTGSRLRGALVVSQVTLAVLLVVAAGLMARSFFALRAVDPGFQPERVLTVEMSLNVPAGLDGPTGFQWIIQRKEELEERLAALPGVEAVGTINRLPLGGEGEPFEFRRTGADDVERTARTDARFVSPGYFAAMGIPLLAGEPFEAQPQGEWLQVVISETTARQLWPGGEALGQRMVAPWGEEAEVVGVAGDVRQSGLSEAPHPAVYLSQFNAPRNATALVIRTVGEPGALSRTVRTEILALDANQPIRSIAPLREVLAESIARDRFFTLLFGVFGALALLLAAVGIYGVLAFSVGQRTREIGVRMALGARAEDVLAMVIRGGMVLVGSGVVLGLVAALLLTRVMSVLLYDVSHRDPFTFLAVPALLVVVALLASYLPARRATMVHPMTAMRNDG
jgi:predicted permease